MRTEKVKLPNGRKGIIHYMPIESGMTEHADNGNAEMWVPEGEDAYSHTVQRHELLHAVYDNPMTEGGSERSALITTLSLDGSTVAGVDDAFVQLNYWPRGNAVNDAEAVETAKQSADNIAENARLYGAENVSMNRARMIALRTLAIMRKLGTAKQYEEARAKFGLVLTGHDLTALETVLDYAVSGKRREAYMLMEELMDVEAVDPYEDVADEVVTAGNNYHARELASLLSAAGARGARVSAWPKRLTRYL